MKESITHLLNASTAADSDLVFLLSDRRKHNRKRLESGRGLSTICLYLHQAVCQACVEVALLLSSCLFTGGEIDPSFSQMNTGRPEMTDLEGGQILRGP